MTEILSSLSLIQNENEPKEQQSNEKQQEQQQQQTEQTEQEKEEEELKESNINCSELKLILENISILQNHFDLGIQQAEESLRLRNLSLSTKLSQFQELQFQFLQENLSPKPPSSPLTSPFKNIRHLGTKTKRNKKNKSEPKSRTSPILFENQRTKDNNNNNEEEVEQTNQDQTHDNECIIPIRPTTNRPSKKPLTRKLLALTNIYKSTMNPKNNRQRPVSAPLQDRSNKRQQQQNSDEDFNTNKNQTLNLEEVCSFLFFFFSLNSNYYFNV